MLLFLAPFDFTDSKKVKFFPQYICHRSKMLVGIPSNGNKNISQKIAR